jgi:hypothetical protein
MLARTADQERCREAFERSPESRMLAGVGSLIWRGLAAAVL